MKALFATTNSGKAREAASILADAGLTLLTLADFPSIKMPEEDGATFAENALKKARHAAAASGLAAIADDSGLEVDALGGAPGVLSARYAGPDATDEGNVDKLLSALSGVPEGRRTARFRCAVAYVEPGGLEALFDGVLEGSIALERRGTGGFGYDPVFILPDRGVTTAELTLAEKNRISHRGVALGKLKAFLKGRSGRP